jgi:hypothetical protein
MADVTRFVAAKENKNNYYRDADGNYHQDSNGKYIKGNDGKYYCKSPESGAEKEDKYYRDSNNNFHRDGNGDFYLACYKAPAGVKQGKSVSDPNSVSFLPLIVFVILIIAFIVNGLHH